MIRAGAIALALTLAAPGHAGQARPGGIVAIGGSVTEIVFALGEGDRLIARDTTSTYPPEANALPDVGYMRALSPEGVLSVAPTLILAEEGAGPPETIALLRAAGVAMVTIPVAYDRAGVRAKILAVGAALDDDADAAALAAKVDADLRDAEDRAAALAGGRPKRVLFILSVQGGRVLASGNGTAAAGIIAMAGAVNAVPGFDGYKALTDEAVAAAAPDAILMMDRGGDHGAAVEEVLALPALAASPAAASRAVVRMDGLHLLGFGPRTAQAVAELGVALYGR